MQGRLNRNLGGRGGECGAGLTVTWGGRGGKCGAGLTARLLPRAVSPPTPPYLIIKIQGRTDGSKDGRTDDGRTDGTDGRTTEDDGR